MAESDGRWSVRELADLAGTTPRTIHYYTAEGLLPPPIGTKRHARYTAAHLARLRLIAALRDEGLALGSIRSRLARLSDAEAIGVAREIDEHLAQDAEPGLSTTLSLIEAADVSEPETAGNDMASADIVDPVPWSPSLASSDLSIPPAMRLMNEPLAGDTAREYLSQLRTEQAKQSHSSYPSAAPHKRDALDRPEVWYHFRIANGIELRVREDRFHEGKGRMRAVVAALRGTLRQYGLSAPGDHDED